MVFAADKVSKARELRLHPGVARHASRRLAYYCDCLRLLEERLPDSPLVTQLGEELERFGAPVLAGTS